MKCKLLSIAILVLLAISAGCAAPMDGSGLAIPTAENGFTEVGNPDEQEAQIKGLYVNEAFDVEISYPERFTLDVVNVFEAVFTASTGEEFTISFVKLADGDTFDSFIADVHGDASDLIERDNVNFDRVLCSRESVGDGMDQIECFYYREGPKGAFVMTIAGRIASEESDAVSARTTENDASRSKGSTTHDTVERADLSAADDSDDSSEGSRTTVTFVKPELPKFVPITIE